MCKKFLVVGAIAVASLVALSVAGISVRQAVRHAVDAVKTQTAPTTEEKLADLRKEVAKLDKDVAKVKDDLAREIVAVKNLTTETTDLRASVDASNKDLMAKGEVIKDATERVKYGSTMISVPEARDRLKKDVAIFVQKKNTLEAKEKTLAQREAIRETLQKQLDALIRTKQEMLAEIDAVEAEYKNVQLQQIEAKYQFDDSRLAKIKEQLRTIRNDVDVEKEKVRINEEINPKLEQKVTATDAGETVDQILAPLNGKK